MKIGIMTFCTSQDNYGQALQAYALQRFLRNQGHNVRLIKYDVEKNNKYTSLKEKILKAFNPIKLYKYIVFILINKKKYIYNASLSLKEQQQNPRYFDDFRTRYINFYDTQYNYFSELQDNPPEADVYIVGSDQVWNPNNLNKINLKAYFLDFGSPEIKRLSYAASWGVKKIDSEVIELASPLLKNFSYVSVREQAGLKLCKQCGVSNPEWVCDPTLLLDADIYRSIYKENPIRKLSRPYLVLYMLNNGGKFDIESVYNFAKEKKLEVVYITGNGVVDNKEKYFATVPEWLYLIDNAQYIVTNSFHCCVFSTIFHKQYGAIKLNGRLKGMNTRFDSLFSIFNIEPRYITEKDFSCLNREYEAKPVKVSQFFLDALESGDK